MYIIYHKNMVFSIKYNEEKNQLLKASRGIDFEEITVLVKKKKFLRNIKHPSNKHPKQRIFLIKIKEYIVVVPYVLNNKKKEIFLKTAYHSRFWTKRLLKGGDDYEKK